MAQRTNLGTADPATSKGATGIGVHFSHIVGGEAGVRLGETQLQVLATTRELGPRSGLRVVGAPRTGKTMLAVRILADAQREQQSSALIIAPNRHAATAIKYRMHRFLPDVVEGTLVHTPASLAFSVLANNALANGEAAPRLLTGAEQDQLIADLLAGHAADGIDLGWGQHLDAQTRSLHGFRDELRDLLNMVVALRLTPDQLETIQTPGRNWIAAAAFYREYLEVKSRRFPDAFDAQELVLHAGALLNAHPYLAGAQLRTVIVDDAQATTLSIETLLAPLRTKLITFGDPDATVNQFEGGQARQALNLHKLVGIDDVSEVILGQPYRVPTKIADVAGEIATHIGVVSEYRQRQAWQAKNPDDSGLSELNVGERLWAKADNDTALLRKIAGYIRRKHFQDQVPWESIAVVARTSGLATLAADVLGALAIPAKHHKALVPAQEQASRVLLDAATAAVVPDGVTAEDISRLATSYLGGMSDIEVRALKRQMRVLEAASGGVRTADELLVAWFTFGENPFDQATADSAERDRAVHNPVVRRFAAFQRHMQTARTNIAAGMGAHEVIWGIWNDAGVASKWQDSVLSNSPTAAIDSIALDAVIALMKNAERFVEQSEDGSTQAWVHKMSTQTIPEDVLNASESESGVFIGTPSALVGTEFNTVVLIGLQEGQWPNLRIRNSLLGANELAQAVVPDQVQAQSRKDVLHDELRLLYYAVTRATKALVVGFVDGVDSGPSAFAGMLDPDTEITVAQTLPSMREYIGRMRRQLLSTTGKLQEDAAKSLRILADKHIVGAAPEQWYGLLPVSTTENRFVGEVAISPSTLESLETCPLAWTVKHIGGSRATAATGVGTLVHLALESATKENADMMAVVDEHWDEIEFEADFVSENEHERIVTVIARIETYLLEHQTKYVGSEVRFQFTVPGAPIAGEVVPDVTVRGSIDRLEVSDGADGRDQVRVVDLKTSKTAVGKTEAESNAQLTCYLLAVAEHAFNLESQDPFNSAVISELENNDFESSGGALFYPASSNVKPVLRARPAFRDGTDDDASAAQQRILQAASGIVGSTVAAHVSSHCSTAGADHGKFDADLCGAQLTPAVCFWPQNTKEGQR